jgi:hypothetical protein
MLGLLGRGSVGLAGPDSELQREAKNKQTNMGTASECARFLKKKADRASYHGRPHRLPRVPPISRDREACRTRRRLP